jgi:mono/diheme cytochrome c family protein
MPGLARHRPAIGAIICLGSLAVDGAPAQAPGAVDRTAGYDAARGESVYTTYCSACHGANGEGRSGMYPPIKGSGVVTKEDATKHIRVVLDGLHGAKRAVYRLHAAIRRHPERCRRRQRHRL